jgi:hypothetical protein
MSRKVHGKGRSQGLSPEELKKLTDGLDPPGLISADERAASTKKRLIVGLPAPRRPAKRHA